LNDSDSQLLARCRAGDQAAWQVLVSRHARRVYGVVYRFTGRVDEAEDLTQEVFIKVFQNLERYRIEEGAFGAWLGTVARHQAIDRYRRRRDERFREDESTLESLPSREAGPLAELERDERVRLVQSGLKALPRDLRAVLVLCDLQGVSYEQAAQMLEVPLGTVKSRLNRGRLELAKRLMRRVEARPQLLARGA